MARCTAFFRQSVANLSIRLRSSRGAAIAARRLLLAAALLLGAASGALAHQDPPNCQGTGANPQLDVFFADGVSDATGATLSECETVLYRATLCHPGGNRCNMQGGTLTLTTPDGAVHDVTPAGGIPLLQSGDCIVSDTISYTVSPDDVSGGLVTAVERYQGGIGHTGTTHSTSSGSNTISNSVAFCDDGDFCNGVETCDSQQFDPTGTRQGVCEAGTPPDCNDNNDCTVDSCVGTTCVNDPAPGTGDSESRGYGVQANVPLLDPLQPVIDALISPNPGPLLIDATPDTDVPGGAPSPFLSIPADPAVVVNVLTAEANQASSSSEETSDATATTADVHLLNSGAAGYLIEANAVVASVNCNADGTTAGSSMEGSMIEGLTIGGQNFDTITEPTTIKIVEPITGTRVEVYLLEKIESGAKAGDIQPNPATNQFESDLTVNGIHVKATDASGGIIADVIVAHAQCRTAFGPVCDEFPHVSGKGYVVGVNADEVLIDSLNQLLDNEVASVRLPSTGGSDDATLKHIGPIGDGSNVLVESNTAFSHTEGTVDNEASTASSETVSQVEDLSLIDTGADPTNPFIAAALVRAECSSSAGPGATDGDSSGSTKIVGLSIGGQDVCEALGLKPTLACANDAVCCEPPPNTDVCAALSLTPLCDALGLTITLNEQTGVTSGNPTDITVNAIHVHLGGVIPGDNGVDVVVSSAHCDAGTPAGGS